jgi:uncharacterized protein with PQ loop repeat
MLDYLPFAAAAFAIPQFLPQIAKLRRTNDPAGVSWPWAALTSVNNAAWLTYFTLAHYWTALVPSISATVLAGALATMLTLRVVVRRSSVLAVAAWTALLVAGLVVAGREGLGTLLTGAFILQVTPSIWTAYRTRRPTGISLGTWALILAELSCWLTFGVHESDPRLIVLGCSGVIAATLMLIRLQLRVPPGQGAQLTPIFRPEIAYARPPARTVNGPPNGAWSTTSSEASSPASPRCT